MHFHPLDMHTHSIYSNLVTHDCILYAIALNDFTIQPAFCFIPGTIAMAKWTYSHPKIPKESSLYTILNKNWMGRNSQSLVRNPYPISSKIVHIKTKSRSIGKTMYIRERKWWSITTQTCRQQQCVQNMYSVRFMHNHTCTHVHKY